LDLGIVLYQDLHEEALTSTILTMGKRDYATSVIFPPRLGEPLRAAEQCPGRWLISFYVIFPGGFERLCGGVSTWDRDGDF
jgi:hypothetical protein